MRGFIASMLCAMLIFAAVSFAEEIEEVQSLDIKAKAAVLIERSSGRVLYAKNENEILPVASTTKIMTALLAIECCSLDDVVTASSNASGTEGTSIYLGVGEHLSMLNMLYGLMLRSGNDAAIAIAEHVDGTVEQFAAHMNQRANELGADALFVTPNGLDKGDNGASALAMARIAARALDYPAFREIVKTKRATIPWEGNKYERVLENKNRLLKELDGATGVKTGFTKKAGRCLVFSCERGGMELVGTVLNCGTWFDSATEMIEWGFAIYAPSALFNEGDIATSAVVSGGIERTVNVLYDRSITLPLTASEHPLVTVQLNAPLKAPIEKGQLVGHALISIDGITECTVDLVAGSSVRTGSFWNALINVIRSWFALPIRA